MHKRFALPALLMMTIHLVACSTTGLLPFVEPQTQSGVRQLFPVIVGANQGAGRDRLGPLSNRIEAVRYYLLPRQTAFLLTGDLAEGSPITALQLPQSPLDDTAKTLVLASVSPISVHVDHAQWSSLRVYDRGECSQLVGWNTIADQLAGEIFREISRSSSVERAVPGSGSLTPRLRSRFPASDSSVPVDVDEFELEISFSADRIGGVRPSGPFLACDNVDMSVAVDVGLDQTSLMWTLVNTLDFARACRPDELDPAFPVLDTIIANDLKILVENREPLGCAETAIIELDGIGATEISEIAAFRLRKEYSGRSDDDQILVGLVQSDGQSLGAHDVLAQVVDVNVDVVESDRCLPGAERLIEKGIERSLRNALPLALADAVLSNLAIDPGLVGLDDLRCESDLDCDLRRISGPVFQEDGIWNGARHTCLARSPDRARLLGDDAFNIVSLLARSGSGSGKFCHLQIEPDKLNIRPDGVEVVLVNSLSRHIQRRFFDEPSDVLISACATSRDGAPPSGNRFRYLPSTGVVPADFSR